MGTAINIIFKSVIILTVFVINSNGYRINLNGKEYSIVKSKKDGVSTRIIFSETPPRPWVARSAYNATYLNTGWDTFDIETNPEINDLEQAFLAGYLEGEQTHEAIYDHFYNIIPAFCDNDTAVLCGRINHFLDSNTQWVKQMIEQHAGSDPYWRQINLFYQQLGGIALGYNSVASRDKKLDFNDIMWMNFNWDFGDLISVLKKEANKALKGNSHCSALIKLLHGQSDIFVAHNTWTGYQTMRRMIKRYTLPYKQVTSTAVSFSGYPGILVSGDDFYITNSGLVVQETTNDNNNASLWSLVKPVGSVLEVVRVTIANRLADNGQSWTKIFSQFNSGTYNNQWMIVDMKKFTPGSVKPGLLWIAEQMPGYIRREDQTVVLTNQGYWASYNRPFYTDIFNLMGNQELVKKYGNFFTYDKTPRALIFKRDQGKVVDLHSMMLLMRSNDFEHDPLSRCDCNPPYSSENTIASRNDLNLINGSYPFPALGHRSSGATDAKVTSYELSKTLSIYAVSGPTTGAHLPPFQWSRSDFNHRLSHRGHPDIFRFQPVLIFWPEQHRVSPQTQNP